MGFTMNDVHGPTRRRRALVTLALVVALVAAACGGVDAEESGEADTISGGTSEAAALVPEDLQGTTIDVAMELPYPPFGFYDEENVEVGFDVELIAGVAERLGVQMKIENSAFDSIIPSLDSGRFAMGWSAFTITAERLETVDFVQYYQEGTAVLVPAGNPDGLSVETLCGVTTAILLGSTQEGVTLPALDEACEAAGEPPIDALVLPASEDLSLAVLSGRAAALLIDRSVAAFQSKEQPDEFEIAPGSDLDPAPFGVAFPKGSELAPAVSAALNEMMADGTYLEILERWNVDGGAVTSADINPDV